MRSTKCLLIVFFVSIMLFLIPSISNAAVEYTRTFPSNDGSIVLNLTGLTLDETKTYSFALLGKGSKITTETKWHKITEYDISNAKITLSSSTNDICNVLKVYDIGTLYVKDDSATDNSYIVDALQVNLKLPYLQALDYTKNTSNYYINMMYGSIGSYHGTYSITQKVNDKTLIGKYLDIKNNNKSITELEMDLPTNIPDTGYEKASTIWHDDLDDGLYLIWVKISGDNCKTIFGCIIHDGLPNGKTVADYIQGEGPKVLRIQVQSPASGTYKTGQTVKIRVYFNKKITGTTVPTLKIKFGNSKERNVTNGTIYNDNTSVWEWGQYIEYSYNIQSGDNGQLATVSLTGGTIKDTDGNAAFLTCPVLTGDRTIKANTEGIVTNNTENQDKVNNEDKDDDSDKKPSSNKDDKKDDKKDDTTVSGKIPYTGASYAVIFAIATILVVGIIAKVKYNDLKDIK